MTNEVIEVDRERTAALVQAGSTASMACEFCRIDDLRRPFGIRRGTAYGLIRDGKIRSISLRKPGHKLGVRLVHVASVRAYLSALLSQQE